MGERSKLDRGEQGLSLEEALIEVGLRGAFVWLIACEQRMLGGCRLGAFRLTHDARRSFASRRRYTGHSMLWGALCTAQLHGGDNVYRA